MGLKSIKFRCEAFVEGLPLGRDTHLLVVERSYLALSAFAFAFSGAKLPPQYKTPLPLPSTEVSCHLSTRLSQTTG